VLAKGLRNFAPPLVGSGLAAGTGGEGLDLTTREAQILTTLELVVSRGFEAAALSRTIRYPKAEHTGTSPWPIQNQL
jgi:hypothetical protein